MSRHVRAADEAVVARGGRRRRSMRSARHPLALVCALWLLVLAATGDGRAQALPATPIQVVLLHSYDTSSEWPRRIGEGVLERLREADIDVDLRQEYLDARRYPARTYLDRARDVLLEKYGGTAPRVLIVCDDAALEFLLEYPQLFHGVPVVFGGVQDRNLAGRVPRDQYTGIIEQFRIDEVITAALRARPTTRRIFVATGNNRVGEAFRAEFGKVHASFPQLSLVALAGDVLTFEQMLQQLRRETTPDDLVMVTPVSRDAAGHTQEPEISVPLLVKASAAPVIGLAYANLNHGLLAVTANTGKSHGRRMAAHALRIIAGASPASVPIEVDRDSPLAFDARQLARWGIAEAQLPSGTQVEHRPQPSFYQANRAFIWLGVGFIAVQSLIIGGLVLNVGRRRLAERTLGDQARALTAANSALEEMNRSLMREQDVRLQAEGHLRHAQKMEAVGRLAGGIAHDFNNLLTVTIGYCELLMSRMTRDTPDREAVEQIRLASEQAATLTQNLLAFSRKQVALPVVVDVVGAIRQMEPMLRRFCGDHVTLVFALDVAAGLVELGEGQLEQIVMNLVINGRDAMPSGGRLEVQAGAQVIDAPVQHASGLRAGRYAVITVTDTGIGMDDETRARIFEPFFTTKGIGRGTGLGLATVYGIITQHGGRVAVQSAVGRGASFTLWLPMVARHRVPTGLAPGDAAAEASRTVLVVEDEPELRRLVVRVLRDAGFAVLAASGGGEAMTIASEHRGRLDLLLTDIVMPGDDGFTVARRIQELRPEVVVAYMSGYTDEAAAVGGDALLLRKPFVPAELLAHVQRALGSVASPRQS